LGAGVLGDDVWAVADELAEDRGGDVGDEAVESSKSAGV